MRVVNVYEKSQIVLSFPDLIFDYSEWILREHPDEGLEIFIDDSALELDESTALPRELVLEYLETKIGNPELVMGYLDHCIFAWKESRARFHDALINKYREKIRSLMAEYQLEGSGRSAMQRDNTIEILEEEVVRMVNLSLNLSNQ